MELVKPSQFPNLTVLVSPPRPSGLISHEFHLPSRLSDRVLLLAWATLLKSYIDEDELYFSHNGTPVAVNLQNSSIIRHVSMQSDFTRGTALFTTTDTAQCSAANSDIVLQLLYNTDGNLSTLVASVSVSQVHLPEIALQLQLAIQALLPSADMAHLVAASPRLSVLNPYPTLLDGPALLHDLVRQGRMHSDVAVDFSDEIGGRTSLTYASMHDAAQKLALRLSHHIKTPSNCPSSKDIVIPLLVPQTPDLYVSLLAVLYSGAAFCPLNLDAPLERIKFVVQDIAADVLVTTSAYKHQIPHMDGLVVCVMDEDDECEMKGERFFRRSSPQDLAYVLYSVSIGQIHRTLC